MLQTYLEAMDERRADYHGNTARLVQALVQEDLHAFAQLHAAQQRKKSQQTKNASVFHCAPISELERNLCPNVVAPSCSSSLHHSQSSSSCGNVVAHDAGNPITAAVAEALIESSATTASHLPPPPPTSPPLSRPPRQSASLIGKPLLLFNPISNIYHSGRIVDERDYYYYYSAIKSKNDKTNRVCNSMDEEYDEKGNDRNHAFSGNLDPSRIALAGESSNEGVTGNEEHEAASCKQYLVHFPAGRTGGGKVDFYHWIFLEEHAINLGYCLIWAQRHRKRGLCNGRHWAFGRSECQLLRGRYCATRAIHAHFVAASFGFLCLR
jgi:hypothetical protein